MTKLCINCKYHIVDCSYESKHLCTKKSVTQIDPVTGNTSKYGMYTCSLMRHYKHLFLFRTSCGPDGKFWEPNGNSIQEDMV